MQGRPPALVLEVRGGAQYEGFEQLLDRRLFALDGVQPIAEIDTQLRLGLRYVNQLPVEDSTPGLATLVGRVQPALLSPFGTDRFDFTVATSFQELRLVNDHGKATLRHGLQAAAVGSLPPGVYVLDIDFYDEELCDFKRSRG